MDKFIFVYVLLSVSVFLLVCTYHYYSSQNKKLRAELLKIRNRIANDRIANEVAPKSQELKDFLKDIDVKGYGVLRIDPDDMFFRSPRNRT